MEEISEDRLTLASIAALKRGQEITYQYCGELVKGEKLWYEIPYFKSIEKAVIKSIWRHYVN